MAKFINPKNLAAWLNDARKAILAAASVLASFQAINGNPTDWKALVAEVVSVLGTGVAVYQVPNNGKPGPPAPPATPIA